MEARSVLMSSSATIGPEADEIRVVPVGLPFQNLFTPLKRPRSAEFQHPANCPRTKHATVSVPAEIESDPQA